MNFGARILYKGMGILKAEERLRVSLPKFMNAGFARVICARYEF